jgi:integrative and conjugative element protein (TIGR02256 family)
LFVNKSYSFNGKQIYIENEVLNLFNQYKQLSIKKKEACGILMCSIDDNEQIISINKATSPKPNDIRKRTYFYLKDTAHQKKLDELYKKSNGTIFLCGTWHTHPENYPKASILDIKEWIKFVKGNIGHVENFYFIIVGKIDIALYTYTNNQIKQITKDSNDR